MAMSFKKEYQQMSAHKRNLHLTFPYQQLNKEFREFASPLPLPLPSRDGGEGGAKSISKCYCVEEEEGGPSICTRGYAFASLSLQGMGKRGEPNQ